MATKRGKSKAKPKRPKRLIAATRFNHTQRALDGALTAFDDENDPEKALELLRQIEALGPMSLEAMGVYLEVASRLQDLDQISRLSMMFVERCPNDPMAYLRAGIAALDTLQPVSAILYYEQFLKLAPDYPQRKDVESEIARLREHLPRILNAFVDDLPKDPLRIASVEKILHHFKLGCFDEVIKRAEQHLQTYPTDCKVRNNLAEALVLKGDQQRGRKIIEGTLELSPENFFARAVRIRIAYCQGKYEQSQADTDKLKTLEPRQVSDLTKAAQSFVFIGDDDGVRWAYTEAKRRDWLKNWPTDEAQLANYYGTCLARAGTEELAQPHWRRAVELLGKDTTASYNLEDVRKPVGERSGPAYFDFKDCMSRAQLNDLREFLESLNNDKTSAQKVDNYARRFLDKYPDVERLLPAMLDRGDEDCQRLALILARVSKQEAVTKARLNYAFGQRGTDEMRYQLLIALKEQGHDFESPVSVYIKGQVQQIELLGFQITDEPFEESDLPEEVDELCNQALWALEDRDGVEAERLLRQVQQMVPDQPDVLNNLAFALAIQDRMEEADAIADRVVEKFPDYFFSKIVVANRLIVQHKYAEALDALIPLQRRKLLHRTEFYALAKAMIHAYVGQGEYQAAQKWLDMFQSYEPEHPELPELADFITSQMRMGKSWLKSLWSSKA